MWMTRCLYAWSSSNKAMIIKWIIHHSRCATLGKQDLHFWMTVLRLCLFTPKLFLSEHFKTNLKYFFCQGEGNEYAHSKRIYISFPKLYCIGHFLHRFSWDKYCFAFVVKYFFWRYVYLCLKYLSNEVFNLKWKWCMSLDVFGAHESMVNSVFCALIDFWF